MECQVNVAQDGGTRIEGEFHGKMWHGYTDGITTWKAFRIPRNANTVPEYNDTPMRFSLTDHAEGIGMTGWDWAAKLSRWAAYDFDAIVGHSDKHRIKMTEELLDEVKEAAKSIPWVTVRKSASGKGLHLYVFFDPPVSTQNHNEHAALARSVLAKMSALAKVDFDSKVDICGQNMWVWHRKMLDTGGLSLIKQGVPLDQVPPHWKDHIKVVTRHRRVTLPQFIQEATAGNTQIEDLFLELTGQAVRIPLDDQHRKLVQWLEENRTKSWWDSDHHMLVAHTWELKRAHQELSLRGIFDTVATGRESPNDHNCYMFPMRNGAWSVRRYSLGCQEAPSWTQDGAGWTQCYYNRIPDLPAAARTHGGMESPQGGFIFKEAEMAVDAAKALGVSVPEIPLALRSKRTIIKPHKDGRLVITLEGDPEAVVGDKMNGWLHDKGKWVRLFNVPAQSLVENEVVNYDDVIRHLSTPNGHDYGWTIRGEKGEWKIEPLVHIQAAMNSMNVNPKEIKNIVGSAVLRPWTLTNLPFQPEYPGNRQWNREAAQLRFVPTQDTDNLHFPHWQKILIHCGQGLDLALRENAWARANGVATGADYLKIWLASIFKEPSQPVPYLFFFGTQNNGKSTFHESVSLLMTKGYQRADAALINPQGFNEELKNAVLCVIEEIDLRKNKDASNRIKDWVTARELPVHPKGRTPYHIINTTHWVQCANDINACPTFPGDTRITLVHVPPFESPEMKIQKKKLFIELEREAPDFIAELLRVEIPPSNDRLNVPVIETAEKTEVAQANRTVLEAFIEDRCHFVPGEMIAIGDFYNAFAQYVDPSELENWSKIKIGRELPRQFPKGRSEKTGNHYYGNISFESKPPINKKLVPIKRGNEVFLIEDPNDNHKGNH